ncbi:ABC transporter ATP-binding protein [Micromonospora sp. WMMD1082]|uniref:ABC transporter ATP-binding protein n=1 Tax=Micromonospora sp. WMMD1082 TaxID=3016104 RepID=UPI002416E9AA|nr:ABC transporter ATP-binding protein [Micromonospora sp. WMMD1082]MDG4796069.1 ABC transporter ATP-binding protein [Micromonospora sp. WMMD1082]
MIGQAVGALAAATRMAWAAAGRWLLARVLLTAVAGAVPVAVAWLMKVVLDRLAAGDGRLAGPVLLLAAAGAAAVLLPELGRYVDAELQRSVGLSARQRLFAAVGRMTGLGRFEDPAFHDRLTLAAETGPAGPPEVVSGFLGAVQGLITMVAFLATLAAINPWMLLVVAVAAVPTLRGELRLGRQRAALLWEHGHAARREFFYAQLMTSVTAAKEVRLYGLGGLFGARMLTELRGIQAGQRRMDRRELLVQALHGLLGAAVAGIGLVWAVDAARSGALTIGDVSVFVAAVAGVQGGLSAVFVNAGRLHEAMLLFGHYRFVVDAPPDLPARAVALPVVPPLQHGVEFDDVWFRYGDDLPWVLRGVSFTVPAGASVALVGRNGAGKSSLVKLLCRFYDPTHGSIRWDGVDLRDLSPSELRARIGVLFQDFMAYDLSAADNIGVGEVGALDERERIRAAARLAGVDEILSVLPRGYDTLLTRVYLNAEDRDDPTSGVVLSGGQWQRVALARALMRGDADLLVLDEPSAGLDAEAEYEVSRRLAAHRAGRTSLLISHRMNTVRDADLIVVLADGEVVEHGRHDELIGVDGAYARLFHRQAAGYQDPQPAA